ncbi:group II truncated hemoglobin [Granulosicoccus antarcticus]|uniref:Group 2 truncated hemoglobin YjbI n=1 Tax=Granulosicoccus antarcticus IMCC3135 TaxID=1192854 RepID=A0A2Z2NZN8_9GAMM|nr:group II truncated hemoglobin [Granulosicoccus antarcticus]ASJ76723.1 Group 2 truncated hemoglobin YjbI [Granulosicoccus antarcticus IMCC3135]
MTSSPTLYQRLGEEPGLQAIAESLYGWMERLPEAAHIHALHQMQIDETRTRLVAFLSRFFDGPDRYRAHYGEPRMRQRHMKIPIGPAERDAWMLCMHKSLQENIADDELRTAVEAKLAAFAEHMRNRD